MEAAARDLEGFKSFKSFKCLKPGKGNAPTEGFKGLKAGKRQA